MQRPASGAVPIRGFAIAGPACSWNDIARNRDDPQMHFGILGPILDIETFAAGSGIRENARLRRAYGSGRWRKRKGIARVRLADGSVHLAELHWYEAAGIGRKEIKLKYLL